MSEPAPTILLMKNTADFAATVAREFLMAGEPDEVTELELDRPPLLRRPGQLFGRALPPDAFWGQNVVSGDRAVATLVLLARRTLGVSRDVLGTMWGVRRRHEGHAA